MFDFMFCDVKDFIYLIIIVINLLVFYWVFYFYVFLFGIMKFEFS